jgi:hypothetical protein
VFFDVDKSDNYQLGDFLFENLTIEAVNNKIEKSLVKGFSLKNVKVNGNMVE